MQQIERLNRTIAVNLTPSLYRELDDAAKTRRRKPSELVRLVLEWASRNDWPTIDKPTN